MSVVATAAVQKMRGLKLAERAVMLTLADLADDFGVCWCSVGWLAIVLEVGNPDRAIRDRRRTVQNYLKRLEKKGKIIIESRTRKKNRSHTSNLYKIVSPLLDGGGRPIGHQPGESPDTSLVKDSTPGGCRNGHPRTHGTYPSSDPSSERLSLMSQKIEELRRQPESELTPGERFALKHWKD